VGIIITPRGNNSLGVLILVGHSCGEQLLEFGHFPTRRLVFVQKRSRSLDIHVETNINKDFLIALDGTVYLLWDYSGKRGWSQLSRKRIPVVKHQLHCKEVDDMATEGFVNLVRDGV